jgi:hypothetical protein
MMRRVAALALATAIATGCGSAGFFQQYEYEEEIYLSLDGTATVYVNGSVAALDALRGASFDTNPNAPPDRARVREFYSTPVTRVSGNVATSRRSNRRFVHLRLDVDDVRRLGEGAPFAWSTYTFARDGDLYHYSQTVGRAAERDVGNVGWTGREIVAFRLHLPSKVRSQDTAALLKRGNILVWEQSLDDRRRGKPLTLDARMDPQSILYTTLWLFGGTFAAVAVVFGLVIWWVLRRGVGTTAVGREETLRG